MGTMYAIFLLVGGTLVLTSIILGGHGDMDADASADADFSADADADIHVDVDSDIDADADVHVDADHGDFDKGGLDTGIWLPFLSMRFWIFGSAFFGLTGVILSLLERPLGVGWFIVLMLSLAMGLVAGTGSAYLFRAIQKQNVNSMISSRQLVGRTARVTLPINSQSKGKIQLMLGDERIDMIAYTDDEEGFQKGEEAFVIQIREGEARIVKLKELKEKN